jgi:hypothetical protein
MLNAADEKDKPKMIRMREARFFDLTVQDDELLAKQGAFGDQLGFASGKIGCQGERN